MIIAKHPTHHYISSDFQRTRRRQLMALTDCRELLNSETNAKISPSDGYNKNDPRVCAPPGNTPPRSYRLPPACL